MANFVYLVVDWATRACAWVDPQRDLAPPLEAIEAHGLRVERILLTHTHHDHVAGLREVAARFPDAPVTLHARDRHRIASWPLPRIEELPDGTSFQLGDMAITAHHAPGHSAGALAYEFATGDRRYLLTGDTVFIRDCGRTDLPTGSVDEMFATLGRLSRLPPETIILPGHHYAPECASWLGRELEESPPFRCRSADELAALP
jgi:hydroxyacylglutathione hydrolase